MAGIFISYRRGDSAGRTGRLSERLRNQFGPQIFMDITLVAAFSAKEGEVPFDEIAVSAGTVVLQVGTVGQVTAPIPINLKATKP